MNLTRLSTWRWGAGALVAGIVLLVACDGENLFDTDSNPFITPQVQVNAPDGAFAGDTIGIAVSATASTELSTIALQIRGAVTKDTTITTASQRSVTALVKVGLPTILTDTLIFVSAVATDRNGNVSKVRADTVSVLGPPVIVSVTGADSLALGASTTLRIRAFGSRRVSQIDVAMRGAVNKDTTIFVNPPVNDATVNLPVTIPAVPTDTSVRVTIVARDVTGLSSAPTTVSVPLRMAAPTVSVIAPATITAGSNLNLTVTGIAMRKVGSFRVQVTGQNMQQIDITETVDPPLTTATEVISIPLPLTMTDSLLTIRVFAQDLAGTLSAPATATTRRSATPAPVITQLTLVPPGTSVKAGQSATVSVSAQGAITITSLQLILSGAVNSTSPITVPITPGLNVSGFVQIPVPIDVTDTLLTIIAVARDAAGNQSDLTSLAARLVLGVTDVTAPTVTSSATPATTAAGSSIQIRVQAKDNVSVTRIGYAVVNPAGDTVGVTPTLVTTSGAVKDTTFSFIVPSTITPRTIRVFGIAFDASGRRGISPAVNVTVADSAAPTITFTAPANGSTLPLNDSVRVQIRVQDPTGIRTIRLHGESTRVDSLGPTRVVQRFAEKVITFPANPGQPMPTDTTITRYLLAIPDSISEPVQIIATGTDSIGNTSAASVTILVGGPRVELRNPVPGSQVTPGGTLLLTAFAVDRSAGIDSVRINVTGAQTASFVFPPCDPGECAPLALPVNDSVLITQNYVVGAATGTITITATAWNRNRVAGQSSPVSVLVSTTAVTDALAPQVRVALGVNDRIELNDTITLTLGAQDVGPSGLRRMGVVVIATPAGGVVAPDTLYRDSVFSGSGRTGLQPAVFKFTLADFGYTETNLIRLPRTLTFQVHAFAVDTVGNTACNTTNSLAALPCTPLTVTPAPTASGETDWYVTQGSAGLTQLVTVVPGFAVPLPTAGSRIADLVVDNNPARPRLYLSNHNFNRLEVLNLVDSTFSAPVTVGSEPWGLFVNNANNRLIVANSGGTNISMVDITQPIGSIAEVTSERILTPNASLFNVSRAIGEGTVNYTITVFDFSDRPQFVAQDANGTLLHSTKPTGAAPDGSVRYLLPQPGQPRPFESKILFTDNATVSADNTWAMAHIDSIGSGVAGIRLYDHVPGQPGSVYFGEDQDIDIAIAELVALGSDIYHRKTASWSIERVGLSDTTYVATSTDRQFVGFGEGAVTEGFASVWLWHCGPITAACNEGTGAPEGTLTDDIEVDDLIGNASERVMGIALNSNGRLGGARGTQSAYYFSNDVQQEGDLRLQGVFSNGVAGGGGGIALHPNHVYSTSGSTNFTLSFVATPTRSIKIVDTFSFTQRGEILIRDNIVGPLRAALPLPSENVGIAGTCDEIWVKLYGLTGTGRAVIINVRVKDISSPALTGFPACPVS